MELETLEKSGKVISCTFTLWAKQLIILKLLHVGTWQDRVEVAVKTLKPGSMSPEAFLQEAEIMKRFSHPHLVAMYAVCTDCEPFYIITEFMSNGALLDFLRKEDGRGKLTFDNLISISAQVQFLLPLTENT